jgi:hypothetical protein
MSSGQGSSAEPLQTGVGKGKSLPMKSAMGNAAVGLGSDEGDRPKAVDLSRLQYRPTYDDELEESLATSIKENMWADVKRSYDLKSSEKDLFLFCVMFDLALNSASSNRMAENHLMFSGAAIPASYVHDLIGVGSLRQFAKSQFLWFRDIIQAPEAHAYRYRKILSEKHGIPASMVIYFTDVASMRGIPVPLRPFVLKLKSIRTGALSGEARLAFDETIRQAEEGMAKATSSGGNSGKAKSNPAYAAFY